MSGRRPATAIAPREVVILDEAVWDAPARLSPEEWLIEAGLDGHRAAGGADDPEDGR
tara:strand:+ start:107 stop:277 length:171 start_codon:yes stop_codon:yes gene_type:complete